jgi:hypothetical protein
MNSGGFSWRRLLGISAFKSRVSREIGIPLTAIGRRRKLGASIFIAIGPVAGTVTVAALSAAKRGLKQNVNENAVRADVAADIAEPTKRRVHFCQVKGITHNNDDGSSRTAALQLCAIGDPVNLIADPSNEHDANAIRVVLTTGQQIGFHQHETSRKIPGQADRVDGDSIFARARRMGQSDNQTADY